MVAPSTSVTRGNVEITKVYGKLDELLANGRKNEFQKLIIETVKSLGFIAPYAKLKYESTFEYAMPFYFLTGMKGLLCHSSFISELLLQPEKKVIASAQCMKYSGDIAPWLKTGGIAAHSLFQLNLLLINEGSKKEEHIKVFLITDSADFFICRLFKKEQCCNLRKSLSLLSEFAYKLSKGNTEAANEMMPSIHQCLDVLSSFSSEGQVQRSDFLALIKECVLTSMNPFSMSCLNEALPVLEDKDTFQLSSVASALPL